MRLELNENERATTVAALYLWKRIGFGQDGGRLAARELTTSFDGDGAPLDDEDIDALIDLLELGGEAHRRNQAEFP